MMMISRIRHLRLKQHLNFGFIFKDQTQCNIHESTTSISNSTIHKRICIEEHLKKKSVT